jgi:hypothetical protein
MGTTAFVSQVAHVSLLCMEGPKFDLSPRLGRAHDIRRIVQHGEQHAIIRVDHGVAAILGHGQHEFASREENMEGALATGGVPQYVPSL